jgi:L-ascorbate metabolism protein UlaG (beta-lactamase superfamily)
MEITLVGQSTLVIRTSSLVIMTDPWWGSFELLRGVPLTMDPETIDPIDIMLVSHNHVDHWCRGAIRLAAERSVHVVGSRKAAGRAGRHGVAGAIALKPGERHTYRGITIHATPAFHPFASDAIGFVVRGDETFYFSGDTRYDDALSDFLRSYSLDVAFVQVAASTYPLVGKDGMDLPDAARLISEIRPKTVVPIHFQVKGKTIDIETLKRWKTTSRVVVPYPGKRIVL